MIRYIGNKSELSDFILPFCPKNPKFWIEPFGGMVGLYFSLNLKEYPDTQFIYNDINPQNCNLLTQLKNPKFLDKISKTNLDKSKFLEAFDMINSRSKMDKALGWLIILTSSNMKDLLSREYNGNLNFELFKYKMNRYKDYFDRLQIYNMDYKKIIQKYDNESDTFIYCDPIYKGYESYYTNHNWSDVKHFELYSHLSKLKSSWILSYYNFPELKEWYKDYKIISTKHNLGIEYLILKGPTLI